MVDLYVYNWLDFASMEITVDSRDGGGSHTKYQSINGVFKVPNVELMLTYQYRNCSTPKSIHLGSENSISSENVDVDVIVDRYPTCNSVTGNATLTIKKKGTNNVIAKVDKEFTYFKGYNISFGIDFSIGCGLSLNDISIYPFNFKEANVTIEVVNKPTCKYSTDGLIKLNTDTSFLSVSINGNKISLGLVVDNTFSVVTGNNTIEIEFDRYTECDKQTIYYNVEPSDPFDIVYTTTNITDCEVPNGSIQIQDWDLYQGLSLLNYDTNGLTTPINGKFDQLPSYFYSLSFVKNLPNGGSCQGSKLVFLPSSEAKVNYKIAKKPLCAKDAGGLVQFESIVDLSGQELTISTVVTLNRNYESNIASDLTPGTYMFAVLSGACGWPVTINVEEPPVEIDYDVVFSSYIGVNCITEAPYSGILFSTNNLDVVDSLNFNIFPSGSITEGLLISGTFGNGFEITLSYGSYSQCLETFYFGEFLSQVTNPPKTNLEFSIVRYPVCGSAVSNFDIKVTNPAKWSLLNIDGVTMDSNGFVKNITEFSSVKGILSSYDCYFSDILPEQNLLVAIDIDTQTTDETCFGSTDGKLEINDDSDQNQYLPIISNDISVQIIAPLESANDLKKFKYLTSEKVQVFKINKNKMSCVQFGKPNYVSGKEPILNSLVNNQCSINELGSMDINPSVDSLSIQFNFSTSTSNSAPLTLFNGVINSLESGNYSISDFKITTDYCKRQFDPFFVNVENSDSIQLNISASSICDPIIFTPLIQSTNSYNYKFKTPSNKIVELKKYGILTIDQFNEIGSYSLTVSKLNDNCKTTFSFELINCTIMVGTSSEDVLVEKKDGNNNLGLKVGLPIGLAALVGIIIATILIIRKKRTSPTKVNDLNSAKHEKKTIPLYQGGRIIELDKF